MRPRTLDEFVGQGAIVGPGRLLRRAIQADQLSSLLFYGPPGTGKTTLARIIANTTAAEFIALNAVLAGVKDIRASIEDAKRALGEHARRTILFVDEVHRFNKAQQDALLPWVENGTVVLVGATTENPYFEVNKALVSRSRVFQLAPLTPDDLRRVVAGALTDADRGYGGRDVQIDDDALDHLVDVANGDARALLNALELAVETTPPVDGVTTIGLTVAEESIQRRAVLYDKEGDAHFDAISAFIKSCRGSDPDAALYWLAKMVYAGEDPRYLLRRMVILASEDVGLADPDALSRVMACAAAFDRVGLPEGRFHLSQATLVLATAPKSNSTMGIFDALKAVRTEADSDVPDHLKDGARDKEGFGHGLGYLYPHAYRDHWVVQQYLPSGLQGQVFYQPSDQGYEGAIRDRTVRRREAQLAAVAEEIDGPGGVTYGPSDKALERWVERANRQSGRRLEGVRTELFERAKVKRHHLVLELDTRTAFLTWEALRQAPEGGVHTEVRDADARARLAEQIAALPELARPRLVAQPELEYDRILGHDVLRGDFSRLAGLPLADGGLLVLAETVSAHTQRLYDLAPCDLDTDVVAAWQAAEERIYEASPDVWREDALDAALDAAGFTATLTLGRSVETLEVSAALHTRWWDGAGERRAYGDWLADGLDAASLQTLRAWTRRAWVGRPLGWHRTTAWVVARR